jgi:hypothetical protein
MSYYHEARAHTKKLKAMQEEGAKRRDKRLEAKAVAGVVSLAPPAARPRSWHADPRAWAMARSRMHDDVRAMQAHQCAPRTDCRRCRV